MLDHHDGEAIYRLALPMLKDTLHSVERLLLKAEGQDEAALLSRRLAPDMFCLAHQIVVLCDGLTGVAAILAGRGDAPETAFVFNRGDEAALGEVDRTFAQSLARISGTLGRLDAAAAGDYRLQAGDAVVVARPGHVRHFEVRAFVWNYAIPNAWFHASMAYALLRQAGVEIGKGDFQGPAPYRVA